MNHSFLQLVAEAHLAEVSQRYREASTSHAISSIWCLLLPVLAVMIAWVIYKIVERPPVVVNAPSSMLNELCQAHEIKPVAKKLLDRIADEAALEQPATLMLGAEHFEEAVEKAGATIKYDHRERATLGKLRQRLFN